MDKKIINSLLFIVSSLLIFGCDHLSNQRSMETWKQEILKTEREFAQMVKAEGLHHAFLSYAADDAVILRSQELVIGKKNIDLYYLDQSAKDLDWSPEFVDVSSSGDLGYTYGHYTFITTDPSGNPAESHGVFHTIWKRQPDGSWKFVWD